MARHVICISRLLGAGGGDVGRMVADSLGYQFVDEEIVQQAAESQGVAVEELADAERRTTVIDRLLKNLALAGGAGGYMVGAGVPIPITGGTDPQSLRGRKLSASSISTVKAALASRLKRNRYSTHPPSKT